MSSCRATNAKARKERPCRSCKQPIKPGDRYRAKWKPILATLEARREAARTTKDKERG